MKNIQKKGSITMDKILIGLLVVVAVIVGAFVGLDFANKANEEDMLAYIDGFSKVEIENQLTPSYDDYGNAYFETDGDFKVMQLTDVHLVGGALFAENDKKALNAVAAMIEAEKPDLVVVTGDISYAMIYFGIVDNSYGHLYFTRLMENLGVYYTVTFGNHDAENYNCKSRARVADMYASDDLKYSLFAHSPEGVSGEGNHVINVKNSEGEISKSLIMLDSHSYKPWDVLGLIGIYDSIKQDQVDWYREIIELYSPKSSLLFFHIPIKEVKYSYDELIANERKDTEDAKWLGGHDGEKDDVVYCPDTDDNLFETVLELGNTRAMFFGHDHFNNFAMKYKGVILSYGYSIDYVAYGNIGEKGYQRGCTILTLTPDGEFCESNIVHKNYYTENYPSVYPKEEVDMYPYFDKE